MEPSTCGGSCVKTFSIESELAAIGSICDGTDEVKAALLAALTQEHFAGEATGELFVRLGSFTHQDRPIPSVRTLRLDPALTDDARDMLDAKLPVAASADDATALVDQLELYRKLRAIYNGTRDVVDSIREPSPKTVTAALDSLEKVIIAARSQYEGAEMVTSGRGDNATPVVDKILDQTKPDRVITGFRQFDEASGGFARKDLVLVAATTGGGKSVMANQLGLNAYLRQNRNVALVSFEMDDEEIYARIASTMTEIPFDRIYLRRLNVKQVLQVRRAMEAFSQHGKRNGCRFSVWCPTFEVTPAQVGAMLKPGGFDEILIDYVGLVDADQKGALWENLGTITRAFKAVARNQNNVVIVMAQLDEETNKVKYSKAMRHHSSYVWKWKYEEEQQETNEVRVEMEKARHCKAFSFDLYANFSVMAFNDKVGSETTRRVIDRLAIEYMGEASHDPDTDEVPHDPDTGEVIEDEPVVEEPPPKPEPKPKPSKAGFNGSGLRYAAILEHQLRGVSVALDGEL